MSRALSRSGPMCAEAGTRAAAPFPAPLSPLAALFLRCAPDKFLLTKPNTFPHNREASVATLRWCSGSSRNAVRLPFGTSVQLHRNPQQFIDPGKPMQNCFIESFNGRLREECLNANWFVTLADARRKIEAWRRDYNEQRPHSSLGYLAPQRFAQLAQSGHPQ